MKLMPPLKTLFFPTVLLFSVNGYSSSASAEGIPDGNWYVKAYGGAGWNSKGKDESVNVGGTSLTFVDKSDKKPIFQYGLGGGYQYFLQELGTLGVGLAWYGNRDHEYKGKINYSVPLSYSYKVETQRVMVESSWNFALYPPGQLGGFVTAGLGIAWNRLNHFTVRTNQGYSSSSEFNDRTKSAFAWQLGAGLNWAFTPEWQASVFYLYVNTGKAEANYNGTQGNINYKTGDLKSHNLMFSLNYLF